MLHKLLIDVFDVWVCRFSFVTCVFAAAAGRAVEIENCVEPGEQYVQLETG